MRLRLALFTTTIIGLLLVAAPALAAAEEESHAAKESFGLWDGLIYAAIGGIVIGLFVFLDSYAGTEDTDAHGDHH